MSLDNCARLIAQGMAMVYSLVMSLKDGLAATITERIRKREAEADAIANAAHEVRICCATPC